MNHFFSRSPCAEHTVYTLLPYTDRRRGSKFLFGKVFVFMSIIMALAGSALTVGSFWTLVTNVSGACSSVIGLVSSIGSVVCSVVAAKGWHGMFVKKG